MADAIMPYNTLGGNATPIATASWVTTIELAATSSDTQIVAPSNYVCYIAVPVQIYYVSMRVSYVNMPPVYGFAAEAERKNFSGATYSSTTSQNPGPVGSISGLSIYCSDSEFYIRNNGLYTATINIAVFLA